MRLFKRIVRILVCIVAVALIAASGAAYRYVTASHPQISGTLHVAGLKGTVEVVRDAEGVPHIYATDADDLFLAQGYVHAQDRLWQMENNRRIAWGTLSDVFGAGTIKQDRFLRTIGLGRAARADYQAMSADEKRPLVQYANGVNAFIDSHLDNLPVEFALLGFKPAPWEPVDTLAWSKVMAYNLGGNYADELLRAALLDKLGAAKVRDLMPAYPATGPYIIPGGAQASQAASQVFPIGTPDLSELSQIEAALGLRVPEVGSNNWVVDGRKSTTGKPLLANDPHLAIQMPSPWYENGLHCGLQSSLCPYNVVGFSLTGVPGVVIGHNDSIAWGVTNAGPDVQDLYIEKINPENPNQYEFQGRWEEMQVIDEPIRVKGVVSETLRVRVTRHGPIISPVLAGVTQPLALQWTALRERSRSSEGLVMLNRARTWDEFRAALRLWDVPSQNFVYADTQGNIGYQMPGNVPIRSQGDGSVPVPGTGEYEWTGYVRYEDLPSVYNPASHYIVTANNAVAPANGVAPAGSPNLIATQWAAPYRAQRITDVLTAKEKLSVADFKALQGDVFSIPGARLREAIVTLTPEGFLEQRAMQHVNVWDGRLTRETVGGAIVEATFQRLLANLFAEQMGSDLFKAYQADSDSARQAVLALLDQPASEWWGSAGRDVVLKKSYAQAVDWLGSQFGDAPGDWHWERLHTATFAHPMGSVALFDRLFNAGPLGVPGGAFTVFATSYRNSAPYAVSSVSSMRQIIDLSNWDQAIQTNSTGQSGQVLNKHYADTVARWRDGGYAPMYYDRAALERVSEGTLVLVP